MASRSVLRGVVALHRLLGFLSGFHRVVIGSRALAFGFWRSGRKVMLRFGFSS